MWGMQYNLLFPAIRFDLHEELFNDGYRYVKELQLHHNDEKRYPANACYVNKGHYSRCAEHTMDLMEMVEKQSVKTINIYPIDSFLFGIPVMNEAGVVKPFKQTGEFIIPPRPSKKFITYYFKKK